MSRDTCISSDLICLECGCIFPIPRKQRSLRNIGHIKDLWCPKCKKNTKFYEVVNIDIYKCDSTKNKEIDIYVRKLIDNNQEVEDAEKNRILKKIFTKQ